MPDLYKAYAHLNAKAHKLSAPAYRTAALLIWRGIEDGRDNYLISWSEAMELCDVSAATLRNHLSALAHHGIIAYTARGIIAIWLESEKSTKKQLNLTAPPAQRAKLLEEMRTPHAQREELQNAIPHTPAQAKNLHAQREDSHAGHESAPAQREEIENFTPSVHAQREVNAQPANFHAQREDAHAQRETKPLDLEEEDEEKDLSSLPHQEWRATLETTLEAIARRKPRQGEIEALLKASRPHARTALRELQARWHEINYPGNVTRYLVALLHTIARQPPPPPPRARTTDYPDVISAPPPPPLEAHEELWQSAKTLLSYSLPPATYMHAIHATRAVACDGATLTIQAPHPSALELLQTRLRPHCERALTRVEENPHTLAFILHNSEQPEQETQQ